MRYTYVDGTAGSQPEVQTNADVTHQSPDDDTQLVATKLDKIGFENDGFDATKL